jgi:serine/threonine-protein kinase
MAFTARSSLGSYEIVAQLGAGGMGEVYRAKDTKLGRDVALKILPASFTNDPERVARFRREAQVLASLNHPHIGAIYGLEEVNGTQFLVLELVDGESLDKRIARGPIPVDEALDIAKQIAEALEAAHEKGIIHRDLKPANIALTKDGSVKVLDFGLAKAVETTSGPPFDAMNSPTITSPAMMTGVGVILGTAAYMAPEQAKGREADKRTDIWAFGCVLYEMLTGHRAFDGEDVSITLAAVLRADPDWHLLPLTIPAGLCRLLSRCLNKDPKDRLQAIGDARVEIDELLRGKTEPIAAAPNVSAGQPWFRAIYLVVGVLIGTTVTSAIAWFAASSRVTQPRVARFEIAAPATATVTITGVSRDVTITPNGSRLVYSGANGTTLFVRPLDQLEATPLVHGDALRDPFVSPDSQWVGFFDGPLTLKKVPLSGGPAVLVTRIDGAERGATWAADGTIIFASTGTGLQRVAADGGAPVVLVRPDSERGNPCWWPEQLPGNQMVLCTVTTAAGGLDSASIAVLDLRTGQSTILVRGGSHAQYVASGHLVFGSAGTLRAIGFDLRRLITVGTARPVVPQVGTSRSGAVDAALAADGTLAYVSGGVVTGRSASPRTLVWVDRQGRETPLAAPPRAYSFPRVSPDGTRVAVMVAGDQKPDIWLWDLARATLTPLTLERFAHTYPVWRPDGRHVIFSSDRAGGVPNVFSQAADGTGTIERLTESPNNQVATAVAPDSTRLVLTELSPKSGRDIMALRLDGTRQVLPLVQTPFDENNGIVSPDGRWLAYEANDSGTYQIYVRPFPDITHGQWQVSTSGGRYPLWARSGRELFYVAPDGAVMGVAVAGRSIWTAGAPTKVLEGRYVVSSEGEGFPRNYDIGADGRFLMMKAAGSDATSAPPQIVVVQHFDEELKRLVPSK